jgi:hypothetical protein
VEHEPGNPCTQKQEHQPEEDQRDAAGVADPSSDAFGFVHPGDAADRGRFTHDPRGFFPSLETEAFAGKTHGLGC